MVKTFFDKKTGSGISVNEQVGEELHKPVIKKFKRRKVYARFKDNIRTADLAEMESWSSKNPNVKYLLCVIDVFIKYAWVNPLTFSRPKKKVNLQSYVQGFYKVQQCLNKPENHIQLHIFGISIKFFTRKN